MRVNPVSVKVDTVLCIGSGQCEMLEPDVFLVDDDDPISAVIGNGEMPRERAAVVIERCPVGAITITDPN